MVLKSGPAMAGVADATPTALHRSEISLCPGSQGHRMSCMYYYVSVLQMLSVLVTDVGTGPNLLQQQYRLL